MGLPKDEILVSFATVTDTVIKYLYNSTRPDFSRAFGNKDADYLWQKFTVHYKGNEGSFFCYLDADNKLKLMRDVFRKYGTEKQ